jgi:integrase
MLKRHGTEAGIVGLHPHAFRHTWAHAFRAAGGIMDSPIFQEATLALLTDPSGIRAELERIRRALPDDPAGAIGAAKQLVEATAMVVLTDVSGPLE